MSDTNSDNSLARTECSSADIQAKYAKLATEYSKIRAQNTVLKKGVIDEQNRNSDLQSAIRERDQTIRKSQQEMESLNFRNQQLSRRVTILQEDLEEQKTKKKSKSKSSNLSNGETPAVLDEELTKMVSENARLLSLIHDKDEEYRNEVLSLTNEVRRLSEEVEICNRKLDEKEKNEKIKIKELEEQLKQAQRDYSQSLEKLNGTELALSSLKKEYTSYVGDMVPKLVAVSKIIPNSISTWNDGDVSTGTKECIDIEKNSSSNFNYSQIATLLDFKTHADHYLQFLDTDQKKIISCLKAFEEQEKSLKEFTTYQNAMKEEMEELRKHLTTLEKENQELITKNNLQNIDCKNYEPNLESEGEQGPQTLTNEIGMLISPFKISEEMIAREERIKAYFDDRINGLITEKQEAFAKSTTFKIEAMVMQKRLENCLMERQEMEHRLMQNSQNMLRIEEELRTTSNNYELQLQMMSEHLANVNDKFTSQNDEIEHLKYQLNDKGLKKNKK